MEVSLPPVVLHMHAYACMCLHRASTLRAGNDKEVYVYASTFGVPPGAVRALLGTAIRLLGFLLTHTSPLLSMLQRHATHMRLRPRR